MLSFLTENIFLSTLSINIQDEQKSVNQTTRENCTLFLYMLWWMDTGPFHSLPSNQ